jgi:hypothetical protein
LVKKDGKRFIEILNRKSTSKIDRFDAWWIYPNISIEEPAKFWRWGLSFDPWWGMIGVIPKSAKDYLIEIGAVKNKEEATSMLKEIQYVIISTSKECWIEKCKNTDWEAKEKPNQQNQEQPNNSNQEQSNNQNNTQKTRKRKEPRTKNPTRKKRRTFEETATTRRKKKTRRETNQEVEQQPKAKRTKKE